MRIHLTSLSTSKFTLNLSIIIIILFACFVSPTAIANGVTYVSDCDATVYSSNPGQNIMVTNDIVKTNTGDCIVVTHPNVTVDCQGYRLNGIGDAAGYYGVWGVVNSPQPTVQNCEFYNWTQGVAFWLGTGGSMLNNNARFTDSGFVTYFNNGAWIEGNKCEDNVRAGIQLNNSSGDTVYMNTVHGTGFAGILVDTTTNAYIVDNQTNRNVGDGIRLQNNADNNDVLDNASNVNGQDGIAIYAFSNGNTVEDNTANRNDRYGIGTNEANSFDNNVCRKNGDLDSAPDGNCK